METKSSGCYVIDRDFNLVSMNASAREIYPQLKIGEKCYKCLMELNEPCGPCPVVNKKMGPRIYLDPIRNIAETVDAVEVEIDGCEGPCHALVFSTVGNASSFAATLPKTAEELKNLALIKALTVDFQDVFSVNIGTGKISLYRHDSKPVEEGSPFRNIVQYDQEVKKYADRYVCDDDKEQFLEKTALDYVREKLKTAESYKIYYRVKLNGETHYYFRKFARAGQPDSFENIIIGVSCNDKEELEKRSRLELEKNLSMVEKDISTGLYTKEAFLMRSPRLFAKYPEMGFDYGILKIENLGSINHQYGRAAGDRIISLIGELLGKRAISTNCIAYLGDGTFASFTENTPTDIRKSAIYEFRDEIFERSELKNLSLKWSLYVDVDKNLSVEEISEKAQYALSAIRANVHEDYVEFDQIMIDRMDWEDKVEKTLKMP